jgi:class 3 adenylate cyclase
MEQRDNTRRLTTVLAADVVGYSKMTARNEEHALRLVRQRFATATIFIDQHDGRVFNTAGDALLAEFASPVEAVRTAIEIQEAMRTANELAAEDNRLQLRIGINLGDVMVSGKDLLGDGVNVAARLEGLAPAGGICVSSAVYEQLIGKLTLGAEDLGEQHVKNIPRPIRAYRLTAQGAPPAPPPAPPTPPTRRLKARVIVPVLGALVVLGAAAVIAVRWFAAPAPGATVAAAPPPPAQAAASGPAQPPRPAPPPSPPARRVLVPEAIPFIDDRSQERVRTAYLPAPGSKALAISPLGHFAWASQRIDEASARKEALDTCNASQKRATPNPPAYANCAIYAVDNDIVWTLRPPPMPPRPWVAATRPTPPIKLDPTGTPIISPGARQGTATGYVPAPGAKAIAIGRGGANIHVWGRASDLAAMRAALENCGFQAGRPCFIYALGDEVVVRVPEIARIVDVLTFDDLGGVSDADRQRITATYLPDADWRALAIGRNGRIGLGLRQAGEQQAIDQALRACEQAGGLECTLAAVGPFKVAAR